MSGYREHVKMSGLRSTSNVRSGADALWAGWASRARPPRPQACCEADLRSGSGRADLIDQGSVWLIVGEPPRTVEHGEAAVRGFVNAHVRLHVVDNVAQAASDFVLIVSCEELRLRGGRANAAGLKPSSRPGLARPVEEGGGNDPAAAPAWPTAQPRGGL